MNNFLKICLVTAVIFCLPFGANSQSTKYKCMVQMTNYPGEGAYIAVSLINSKGEYEKTLYVMGSDKKWYPDLKEWHTFYKRTKGNISAITGASAAGGERSIMILEIDDAKLNSGYVLRFESAVENQKYISSDLEIPLTTANVSGKTEGTGYIRYVRLSPN